MASDDTAKWGTYEHLMLGRLADFSKCESYCEQRCCGQFVLAASQMCSTVLLQDAQRQLLCAAASPHSIRARSTGGRLGTEQARRTGLRRTDRIQPPNTSRGPAVITSAQHLDDPAVGLEHVGQSGYRSTAAQRPSSIRRYCDVTG